MKKERDVYTDAPKEIQESLDLLNGKGPDDVKKLTIELAKRMLTVAEVPDLAGECTDPAQHLKNGMALQKFKQMIDCHGGDLNAGLPKAENQITLPASKSGIISKCDAENIGRASLLLGAGRAKTTDTIDHAVGISNLKKIGERVEKDEPLGIIHSNGHEDKTELFRLLETAFTILDEPVDPPPLILEVIGTN